MRNQYQKHNYETNGFVYIMQSRDEGVKTIKVGMSNNPERRKLELEQQWGTKFDILFKHQCDGIRHYNVEQLTHRTLNRSRLPLSEFFTCSPEEAKSAILISYGYEKGIIPYESWEQNRAFHNKPIKRVKDSNLLDWFIIAAVVVGAVIAFS